MGLSWIGGVVGAGSGAAVPDGDADGRDELDMGAYAGDEGASTDLGAAWFFFGEGAHAAPPRRGGRPRPRGRPK
jgi:hypothetical protein